jgi:predicted phage tail protein
MADNIELFEGAGGGQQSATNTPDNLFSEDVIEIALALSEGPIRGLTQGAKSFYVGNTPLMSQDGTLNFEKFAIGVHPGYPEGMAKELNLVLGGESSNTNVGVVLFNQTPVTRQTDAILRNKIDTLEVRINFNRLMKTDDNGNYKNTAQFKLEYKASKAATWKNFYSDAIISLEGKTTAGVVKEFSVSVPRINDDYQVRVTKISPDSTEKVFVDMTFDSFQMITKGPRAYPDTAVVHLIGVSTGQLSSVPDLMGIYDGLLVRVPTNYNPDTRTYDDSVPWNGSFKFAWTDNPAWILYDMIVNPRYGLAAYRVHVDANRFDFYLAARWCDTPVLVDDGPETRPRFTFNDIIVEPRPAMEMLNYVAGSFNAIVWDDLQGQIHLKVDKDDPAVAVFSPENVTESGFEYSFTDITTRANDISVSFINPDLDWNEDVRRIPNVTTSEDHIAKFGRIPLNFIAVGCTNAHEAVTKAQVRLISSLTETTMVSFTTTRQGSLLGLLDIILVADPLMGWSQSGRLTTYDANFINFRDPIFIEEMKQYVVKLQTVDGIVEVNVQPEQVGEVRRFKLLSALPPNIPRYTVFALEDTSGFGLAKPFRVTSIEEVDGSPYQFKVSAIELNRNKYTQSETNTNLDEIQYSYKNPALPGAPTNFKAETGDVHALLDPNTGVITSRIFCSWVRPYGVVVRGYELQYQRDGVDADWTSVPGITTESGYISPALPGVAYNLRVAAINPNGNKSGWASLSSFVAKGPTVKPATVATFTATGDLFQNILKWTFSGAPNILKVEVWGASVNDLTKASKLADLAYPTSTWTHLGLSMGVTVFYWLRVQNTSLVYSDYTTPARSATTVSDPDRITQILKDRLDASTLLPALRSRIDLIDVDVTSAMSVAARLKTEADARIKAVNDEITARTNAITTEVADRTKAVNDEIAARTTAITAESTARTNALAAEALARGTAITNEASTRQSADTSLATSITTLTATTANNLAAAIKTEQTARTDGDTAVTNSMTTLVSQTQTNIQAGITSEATTRANADTAMSSTVNALTTRVGTAESNIVQINNVSASSTSAIASTVSNISSRLGTAEASITAINDVSSTSASAVARSVSSLTARMGTAESNIVQINTVTTTSTSAAASTLANISTRVGTAEGSISQLNKVDSTSTSALVTAFLGLQTRVGTSEGKIDQINTVTTTSTSAVASTVANISTRVGTTESAITQLNKVDSTSTSALVTAYLGLVGRVGTAEGKIDQINTVTTTSTSAVASTVANISTRVGTAEGKIDQINNVSTTSTSVVASTVASLSTRVGTAEGKIDQINTVTTTSTSAVASTVANLSTRVGSTESSITQLNTVSSSSGSALARTVNTLSTTVDGHTSSISNLSTTVNGISAQYYVKTDVNGFVSGFGLSSTGATSEFIVSATRFAIASPNYTKRYPFIVDEVNGVSVIAMNGAIIADGTISAKAISVTSLSAINANIGTVTAGLARNSDGTSYINFNARPGTTDAFLYVSSGNVVLRADGSGYFARNIVSAPNIVASGNVACNTGWIGYVTTTNNEGTTSTEVIGYTIWIDTGVYVGSNWSTAATDMYLASCTISGGQSLNGGANGWTTTEVAIGDGLLAGGQVYPYDNRIYIKFTWTPGGGGGQVNILSVSWKLVRV